MRRKPTKKDIIFGCWELFWDIIVNFLLWRFDRAKLDGCLLKETAKGNFEILEDDSNDDQE